MGTKNNPGEFDCYAKAEPDEPLFVLLARDPFASGLVRLWASLRSGDIYGAVDNFHALANEITTDHAAQPNTLKVTEADACAEAMYDWYTKNRI